MGGHILYVIFILVFVPYPVVIRSYSSYTLNHSWQAGRTIWNWRSNKKKSALLQGKILTAYIISLYYLYLPLGEITFSNSLILRKFGVNLQKEVFDLVVFIRFWSCLKCMIYFVDYDCVNVQIHVH